MSEIRVHYLAYCLTGHVGGGIDRRTGLLRPDAASGQEEGDIQVSNLFFT